jgi:hypothetical protein
MSWSRFGLMFERVCACRKLTKITSAPSWSGTRSGGTPSNPDARSCAGFWAVDRGTGAHQQFREPLGSSCCLLLLASGFWPTTHSGTPSGQNAMKVDTQPFPSVKMVEGYNRSVKRQLDFAFGINMVGPALHRHTRNKEADPCDRPQNGKRDTSRKNK